MQSLKWLTGLALAASAPAQTPQPQTPPTPVVLELFTSEGCSSCVSADTLFAQIERGGRAWFNATELITLGEHVDYWDSAEWRDRFSSPLFSSRQQDYGRAFHAQDVFTPQVVVNGQMQCIGSDLPCIQRAVQEASRAPRAAVGIRAGAGADVVSVSVQHLPPDANPSEVLLGITESGVGSNILGGENRGRRAVHTAVVRSLTQLSRLDVKKSGAYNADVKLNLNPHWDRRNLKLVVLVQDRTTRRIVGAAASPVCAVGPAAC
ncbi:MAG TPA: DUF1223 domain-containing protein [Bryobacteraceae bacterium]|nr:DUF1223 domain-containing protein [Bryobacteraceae bacterium]